MELQSSNTTVRKIRELVSKAKNLLMWKRCGERGEGDSERRCRAMESQRSTIGKKSKKDHIKVKSGHEGIYSGKEGTHENKIGETKTGFLFLPFKEKKERKKKLVWRV